MFKIGRSVQVYCYVMCSRNASAKPSHMNTYTDSLSCQFDCDTPHNSAGV